MSESELEQVVSEMDAEERDILGDLLEYFDQESDEDAAHLFRADVKFSLGIAKGAYHIDSDQAASVLRGVADDLDEHGFNYREWDDE